MLDILYETYGDSIAIVRYHGWWPGANDPFYLFNPSESQARIYYLHEHRQFPNDGLYAPHTWFDCLFDAQSNNNQYETKFLQALAVPGQIDLDLDVDVNLETNEIHLTCNGVPEQAIAGDLFLRYALTETQWDDSHFHQVMRDMIPTPEGTPLDLSTGQAFQDEQIISIDPVYTLHNLEVVAFVQEDVEGEVFQTAQSTMPRDLPRFSIGDIALVETGSTGDGDGVVNPGEDGLLSLFVAADKDWGSADQLLLHLSTDSEFITFTDAEASVPSIAAGDTVWLPDDEFALSVSSQSGMGEFSIDLTIEAEWADGRYYTQELHFTILVSMNQSGFPVIASGEILSSPAVLETPGGTYLAVADEAGYVHVIDGYGQQMQGFPVQAGERVSSSPVITDIDGDEDLEIVVGSWDKKLYCFDLDGAELWSMDLGGYITGPPAVGDVNGDGIPDIVAATMAGDVYVLDMNGNPYNGWPVSLGGTARMSAGVCLADLDNDSAREIIVGTWSSEIHALYADGSEFPGWPVELPGWVKGGVVAAPVLGYSVAVIAPCGDDNLYVIGTDGAILGSVETEADIMTTPAVCDIDANGIPDIIFGTTNGHVYVVDGWLNQVSGWPVDIGGARIESSPVTADIDGDGYAEIVIGAEDGFLHILDHQGIGLTTPLDLEERIRSTPAVADVDGDGDLDLFVGAGNAFVGLDLKNAGGSIEGYWNQYRAVAERTGWLTDTGAVPVGEIPMASAFQLHSLFPNPSSNDVVVRYSLPRAESIQLAIHDVAGHLVKPIENARVEEGTHQLSIPISDLSNGVYFMSIRSSEAEQRKPFVILR